MPLREIDHGDLPGENVDTRGRRANIPSLLAYLLSLFHDISADDLPRLSSSRNHPATIVGGDHDNWKGLPFLLR